MPHLVTSHVVRHYIYLDLKISPHLSKRKMASASGHINIDNFDADASASGQRTAEETRGGEVENGASQDTEANLASYSTSFSSQENRQNPQRPSNNPLVGSAASSWGYDPTFGHYPLDPALSQPSYHQPPYGPAAGQTPFRLPSSQSRYSSPPWESPSPSPAPSTQPAPRTSITPDERRDGTTAGTRRGGRTRVRGSSQRGRGRGATSRAASQSMTPAPEASPAPIRETSEGGGEGELETYGPGERHQKKARIRNMNKHEKLVLIRECCEHRNEYRALNKTKFWAMISDILKQQTGYHLVNPQQTVTNWVKAQIDELVEEEMGSGTEVERNDFKTAVETFAERMKNVAQEIEDAVQSRKAKAAESLAAARLEDSLVFQLDDEPIPGVDTPSVSTTSSIALGSRPQKRKRDADSSTEPSADAVLMNSGLKDAAVALADAYTRSSHTGNTQKNELASSVNQVEKRMDSVENSLGEVKGSLGDMKGTLGSMQEMIGGVLQALARMNAAAGLGPPTSGAAPTN